MRKTVTKCNLARDMVVINDGAEAGGVGSTGVVRPLSGCVDFGAVPHDERLSACKIWTWLRAGPKTA